MSRQGNQRIAGFMRIALVALVFLCQIGLIIFLVNKVRNEALYIYLIIEIVSVIEIMILVSRNRNSSYTIAWILTIVFMPVFGYILYILWGRQGKQILRNRRLSQSIERGGSFLEKDPAVYAALQRKHPDRKRIAGYLGRKGFPVYQHTSLNYFALGEQQFDAMLEDMERAGKYIFLAYFIIAAGELWTRFEHVLIRKASEGVEVRIMYDDIGSIVTLPDGFIKNLEAKGIKVRRFNPIHGAASRLYFNDRNHQKIAVIDGNIGYTGGTNLADEYANLIEKHGHWKDTAVRLYGDAVWSLTVTFLQMWDGETGDNTDYGIYRPSAHGTSPGFVQPFTDGPLNNPDNPAEHTYRSIIANAKEYVYITTPYLIIGNSMQDVLTGAAESGVDVRIITPKIWDHWYVHMVTQSNYKELLKAGVRIFEYTPGYIHGKTIISDDDHGVTGSINMDYRSFHLHFENGVWICGDPVLGDIKQDILDTFAVSEEIMLEDYLKRPFYVKAIGGFLRIFSVLL